MTGTTPIYGIPYLVGGDELADLPASLQDLAEAVESSLAGFGGIASPGSWQTPTLLIGTDFGAGTAPIRYRKIGAEVVIRGALGGLGGGMSAGTTIFQLPAGFRPLGHESFRVASGSSGAEIVVLSTGEVQSQTTVAAGAAVSLGGVNFWID